jgi:DNA-binding response OmpR family regulator
MQKILVFDENVNILALLTEEISDEGFRVIQTEDPQRLLEIIDQEKPNLLIMEIKLNGCDGLALLDKIRFRHHDLPIIVWSVSKQMRFDPRIIGADYHILKSSRIDGLKKKIAMALEANKTMAEVFNSQVGNSSSENGRTGSASGLHYLL